MDTMRWSECSHEHSSAPTIKNHSVTHFSQYLFCFGGYDGRRNHMTLLVYSIQEERWIRPHHVSTITGTTSAAAAAAAIASSSSSSSTTTTTSVSNAAVGHQAAAAAAAGNNNISDHPSGVVFGVGGIEGADSGVESAGDGERSDNHGGGMGRVVVGNAVDQQQQQQQQHPSIIVQGTPPPGRNGHSATLATDPDDEENGRIIIIGGWLGTGPLAASDMHILDISAGGRQLRWYQPAVKGTPPGPCNMHSADFVASRREVYVFRGGNGREYLNDLHALNVDSLCWRRVETRGAIPQQRANHSSAMLDDDLIVFGGWNGTERLNDIHILDTRTSTWTCPRVGGVLPQPRAGMTLTALRGRLFLFGGSGTSAKCFQDLQILDLHEMAWLDVSQYDPNSAAGGRGRHEAQYEIDVEGYRAAYDAGASSMASARLAHQFGLLGGISSGSGDMLDDGQFVGYPAHQRNGYGMGFPDLPVDDATQRPQQGGTQDESSAGSHGGTQGGSGAAGAAGGGVVGRPTPYSASRADWRSRDLSVRPRPAGLFNVASPNPNDEDTVPTVLVQGRGPGRRAGHTATAVNRKIYIFGGSCGSDYLNDFFVLDTDPPPVAIVSEPTSLQLFERRLGHFFNDEEFADVTFLVQGQKVYGHKMVLSIVSDCFRAMFTTGFRESEAMEIEIPETSHMAFLAVMEYIYTGALPKMDINSHHHHHQHIHHQDRDRNLGRVVEMLELADRFFLDHLKQICETMLQPAVNVETAEYLLGVAHKTNAHQLQAVCEHFLRNRDANIINNHNNNAAML